MVNGVLTLKFQIDGAFGIEGVATVFFFKKNNFIIFTNERLCSRMLTV